MTGQVIAAHGRHYLVRTEDGARLVCFTRGKRSDTACGDRVEVQQIGPDQGVINRILPRDNLMYRSDAFRKKLLAANVSQLFVVLAVEPSFSEELLGRALVAAEVLEVPAYILLNKTDLSEAAIAVRQRLNLYTDLGYNVENISVKGRPEETCASLRPLLAGKTTLLLGQSGMGKSSLLNLLVPDAQAATREISIVLQSGKHTTTDARLYDLPNEGGALIDTPGFQEFGLAHLTPGEVERSFPELRTLLGQCRFANCTHLAEPDCAVRTALQQGRINPRRYELFADLTRASGGAH